MPENPSVRPHLVLRDDSPEDNEHHFQLNSGAHSGEPYIHIYVRFDRRRPLSFAGQIDWIIEQLRAQRPA